MASYKGDLFVRRFNPDGSFEEYGESLNVTVLTIAPESEVVARLGTGIENEGKVLDSFTKASATTVKIGHNSLETQQGLEFVLRGRAVDVNIDAAVIDEGNVNLVPGKWMNLGYIGLTDFVLKKPDDSSYQQGLDYEVNPEFGLIKALPGRIQNLINVPWMANLRAFSTKMVEVASDSEIKVQIEFKGMDKASMQGVLIHVPLATIVADGELEMFGDDHVVAAHTVMPQEYMGKNMTYQYWSLEQGA